MAAPLATRSRTGSPRAGEFRVQFGVQFVQPVDETVLPRPLGGYCGRSDGTVHRSGEDQRIAEAL